MLVPMQYCVCTPVIDLFGASARLASHVSWACATVHLLGPYPFVFLYRLLSAQAALLTLIEPLSSTTNGRPDRTTAHSH